MIKLLFDKFIRRNRSTYSGSDLNYLLILFLLLSPLLIWKLDLKVAQAEEVIVGNVDHDIEDIIHNPKTKYKPSEYQPNSRTEADLPREMNRRETQSRNANSQQGKQPVSQKKK